MIEISRKTFEFLAARARRSDRRLDFLRVNRTKIQIAIVLLTIVFFAAIPFFDPRPVEFVLGGMGLAFLSAVRGFKFVFSKFSRWLEKRLRTFTPFFTLLPLPLPPSIRARALVFRVNLSFFLENPGAALRALTLAPSFPRSRLA